MKNLSFGQIFLLIVFILVPLINLLRQRASRRLETQTPKDEALTQMRRPVPTTPASIPAPRVSRNQLRESDKPTAATPLSRRRLSQRALLVNRRDVRRGIIIMTILGPCRTFDPLD
jgi:hypothetical protein